MVGLVLGSFALLAIFVLAARYAKRRAKQNVGWAPADCTDKSATWYSRLGTLQRYWSNNSSKPMVENNHDQAYSDKMVTVQEAVDVSHRARAELRTNANRHELSARQSVNGYVSGWAYG